MSSSCPWLSFEGPHRNILIPTLSPSNRPDLALGGRMTSKHRKGKIQIKTSFARKRMTAKDDPGVTERSANVVVPEEC